jgi:hypothetical protein
MPRKYDSRTYNEIPIAGLPGPALHVRRPPIPGELARYMKNRSEAIFPSFVS